METKEWLESLKPGDEVAFSDRYSSYSIIAIERITKTQILLNNGYKFRKDSGYMVGGNIWNHATMEPVTEKIKNAIKRRNLKIKIGKIEFKSLSNEKIERILAIVNEAENG